MNAPATIEPTLDEITVFMGKIPAEEYAQRDRLRRLRNAATGMVNQTPSGLARALAWHAIEAITPTIYSPAPAEYLALIDKLASRLLKTGMVAEDIEAMLESAHAD
jgi:hypothetical protein